MHYQTHLPKPAYTRGLGCSRRLKRDSSCGASHQNYFAVSLKNRLWKMLMNQSDSDFGSQKFPESCKNNFFLPFPPLTRISSMNWAGALREEITTSQKPLKLIRNSWHKSVAFHAHDSDTKLRFLNTGSNFCDRSRLSPENWWRQISRNSGPK